MADLAKALEALPVDLTKSVDALDQGALCDLENARIPHINVHVFRETDAFAQVWERAASDRRLVSATTTVLPGGLPAAINKYKTERTPELLIVETESHETVLEYEVDALAEVADPGTQLIIVGHQNDIALYQKLLHMGVANYMVYPVTVQTIIGAISEVYREPGRDKIGRVHAVIGARGGVGASTVAQNVAYMMSEHRNTDTLLVDLDLTFGTGALNLDVEPNQGLLELADQADRIDVAMLDRVLIKRGRHLHLLGTTPVLEAGREIDSFAIERLLDTAATHMPHIVLDIPTLWNEWVERALTAADTVTVVATPDLSSLRNATALMATLKGLRPNDRPPVMVLNQVGMARRREITAKDITSVMKIQPLVAIPHDPAILDRAQAQGRMISELGRRKPVAKALDAIVTHMAPPARVPPEIEKKRRRKR